MWSNLFQRKGGARLLTIQFDMSNFRDHFSKEDADKGSNDGEIVTGKLC